MRGWQPIKTAPKNGMLVELKRGTHKGRGFYGLRSPDAPVFKPTPPDPLGRPPLFTPMQEQQYMAKERGTMRWVLEGGLYLFPEPTHWRPIPESAAKDQNKAGTGT